MLIFHGDSKNKIEKSIVKKKKKGYKSVSKQEPRIIPTKVLEQEGRKKREVKKKLLKRNKQFLERLGLKLK